MGNGILVNPVTRERITLRSVSPDSLRLEMQVMLGGIRPPLHLHRRSAESFEIAEGRMTVVADGVEHVLGQGQTIELSAGTPHTWWYSGGSPLRFIVEFRPAGQMQSFFETLCGLATEGLVDAKGHPPFLQIVASARHWDTYLAGPPVVAQRMLFVVLGPAARTVGYRASYPRFEGVLAPTVQESRAAS